MNILKLYITFFQTYHFTPFKNKKIYLSQFKPYFFEGINPKNTLFKINNPCLYKINIYF